MSKCVTQKNLTSHIYFDNVTIILQVKVYCAYLPLRTVMFANTVPKANDGFIHDAGVVSCVHAKAMHDIHFAMVNWIYKMLNNSKNLSKTP